MQTMSQIGKIRICLALVAMLVLSAGCGKGTDSGKAFVPEAGHLDKWASHLGVGTSDFHGTFIKSVPPAPAGPTLFVLHCAPCHGNNAAGRIGPDIRQLGLSLPIVNAAIQNVPLMLGHGTLSQGEVQAIIDYIAALATSQPLSGSLDPALCTQCHGADLRGGIAVVSCFSCHNGPDGSIGHPVGWLAGKDNPAAFHGRYGRDLVSGCTTCHGANLTGSIVLLSTTGVAPACTSCHNGAIAPLI
jgi:hypothetical protein